jgi:hypothetical protein
MYSIGVYYEMWQKQLKDESEGKITSGENEGSSKDGDDSKSGSGNHHGGSHPPHHGHGH